MKLKRLFTAILSAALTLSLCAMPAMAEGGATGTGAAGTTGTTGTLTNGTPVWDKTKKGSITIHKYEYNPVSGTRPQQGTGAEGETAPSGATPLDGVTFHIYKVRDKDWLAAYYSGNKTVTGQDLSSHLNANDYVDSVDPTTGDVTFKSGSVSTGFFDCGTFKTVGGGIANVENLEFGLYLVVETSAPDKVTAPADPFLVSVPMTRIANTTTTNKLTDWIYDVHVYPKNATTYGQVTIEKKGYTGGGTGVALEGVKFKLEKKNGTDWTNITTNDSNSSTYDLTTDTSGKITIAGLSQGEYRIYEEAYNGDSANMGYILDAEYHAFTVDKDGKIKVGGSPATTIEVANHRPDMTKQVKKGDSWAQDAQYGVGDTVPYKITIDVPQNIDKLSTFTVTDTPTNLEDKTDTIKVVKVKAGTETDDTTLVKGTDYTVTSDATTGGFTLTFKQTTSVKACAGRTVTITYDAVVKDTAVVGNNGNSNKATLTYTNKIDSNGDPDTTTNTIEDSAVMYSFGIKVKKTAGDTNAPLEGVEFNLYKAMTAADATAHHYTALSNADTTKYGLGDAGTGNVWVCIKAGLKTGTDGIIDTSDRTNTTNYTHGLAYGDYYLVETKTAESYNLLTKPVKVELHVTASVQWKENTTFDATTSKLIKRTITSTTFTNSESATSALVVANIVNRKGFTLPVTGGFGTLLFSGIGLLLVLVGVSVLFSLKKKTNRA